MKFHLSNSYWAIFFVCLLIVRKKMLVLFCSVYETTICGVKKRQLHVLVVVVLALLKFYFFYG